MGGALAAGAGRADVPPSPHSPDVVLSLEGTVWAGTDSHGSHYTFRYQRGGVLSYTSPSGTFRNGTWRQSGTAVYMEMNRRYAEYRGEVRGGRIVGRAGNVTGLRWTWDVRYVTTAARR